MLKNKTKYDAIKAAGTDQKDLLTELGIIRECSFGDFDVYSFQEIFGDSAKAEENRKRIAKNLKAGVYGAVIFDEAHYFVSDADFNVYTREQFDWLIESAFAASVLRIYLTATPVDIYDFIKEKEYALACKRSRNYYGTRNTFSYDCDYNCHMLVYHFQRDYTYLQVRFFPNEDEKYIVNEINESSAPWLIFVDNIDFGNEIERRLKHTKTTLVLDSKKLHACPNEVTDRDKEAIRAILDDDTLTVDVLIATKCLDVGINIKNKNINIVNYLTDPVDIIQAIGRKRVSKDEVVTLYIPAYTKANVNQWYVRACRKLEEVRKGQMFIASIASNKSFSQLPFPVYYDGKSFKLNSFSIYKAESTKYRIEKLLKEIDASEEEDTKVIAGYFLDLFCEGDNRPDSAFISTQPNDMDKREQILNIVNKHLQNQPLSEEVFQNLCNELSEYDNRTTKNRSDRKGPGTRTVNSIMRDADISLKLNKCGDVYRFSKV